MNVLFAFRRCALFSLFGCTFLKLYTSFCPLPPQSFYDLPLSLCLYLFVIKQAGLVPPPYKSVDALPRSKMCSESSPPDFAVGAGPAAPWLSSEMHKPLVSGAGCGRRLMLCALVEVSLESCSSTCGSMY